MVSNLLLRLWRSVGRHPVSSDTWAEMGHYLTALAQFLYLGWVVKRLGDHDSFWLTIVQVYLSVFSIEHELDWNSKFESLHKIHIQAYKSCNYQAVTHLGINQYRRCLALAIVREPRIRYFITFSNSSLLSMFIALLWVKRIKNPHFHQYSIINAVCCISSASPTKILFTLMKSIRRLKRSQFVSHFFYSLIHY